jgi:hypothetical protein
MSQAHAKIEYNGIMILETEFMLAYQSGIHANTT